MAATLYGVGKTFFWPTTLGLVSEQYPRGGALLLNAIAGVGMIAVGTIGGPAIGTLQDKDFNVAVRRSCPEVHAKLASTKEGLFSKYEFVDSNKVNTAEVDPEQAKQLEATGESQPSSTCWPGSPCCRRSCACATWCLIVYFMSRGGYKAEVLTGHAARDEKFTGGVRDRWKAEHLRRSHAVTVNGIHCSFTFADDRLAARARASPRDSTSLQPVRVSWLCFRAAAASAAVFSTSKFHSISSRPTAGPTALVGDRRVTVILEPVAHIVPTFDRHTFPS